MTGPLKHSRGRAVTKRLRATRRMDARHTPEATQAIMSKASKVIREIREELAGLSNEDLEAISWLRIDYAEPGPDCEGVRLQLRTRLAEEMLDKRSGISKADRKALTPSLCRAVRPNE